MSVQTTVRDTMRAEVHSFRVYSVTEDKWVVSPSKRTANDIKNIGDQIVADSCELIEQHQFDQHGRYHPSDVSTSTS